MSAPLPMWTLRARAWDKAEEELGQSRREKREALQKALQANAEMGVETTPEMLAQLTDELGGPMAWLTGTFPAQEIVSSLTAKANENAMLKQMQQQQGAIQAKMNLENTATDHIVSQVRAGNIDLSDPLKAVQSLSQDQKFKSAFGDQIPGLVKLAGEKARKAAVETYGNMFSTENVEKWALPYVETQIKANRFKAANDVATSVASKLGPDGLRGDAYAALPMVETTLRGMGINDTSLRDEAMKIVTGYARAAESGQQVRFGDAYQTGQINNTVSLERGMGEGEMAEYRLYPQKSEKLKQEARQAVQIGNDAIFTEAAAAVVDRSQFGGKDADKQYQAAIAQKAAQFKAMVGDYDFRSYKGELKSALIQSNGHSAPLELVKKTVVAGVSAGKVHTLDRANSDAELFAVAKLGLPPGSSVRDTLAGYNGNINAIVQSHAKALAALPQAQRGEKLAMSKQVIEQHLDAMYSSIVNTRGPLQDFNPVDGGQKLSAHFANVRTQMFKYLDQVAAIGNKPAAPAGVDIYKRNAELLSQQLATLGSQGFLAASKQANAARRSAAAAPAPAPAMPRAPVISAPDDMFGSGYLPRYVQPGKLVGGWGVR